MQWRRGVAFGIGEFGPRVGSERSSRITTSERSEGGCDHFNFRSLGCWRGDWPRCASCRDGFPFQSVPETVPGVICSCAKKWSEWQDLNLRPPRPERCGPIVKPANIQRIQPCSATFVRVRSRGFIGQSLARSSFIPWDPR
jgi:hypothetical protein